MNTLELTAAVTAIANAIACGMTPSEIALVAGLLVQLGDTLATIAAQKSLCEEQRASGKDADALYTNGSSIESSYF